MKHSSMLFKILDRIEGKIDDIRGCMHAEEEKIKKEKEKEVM